MITTIYRFVANHLHRKSDYETRLPHFPEHTIRKYWVELFALCLVLTSGCSPPKVEELENAVLRENFTITALSLHLEGTILYEKSISCPFLSNCKTEIPWIVRHARVPRWIGQNSNLFHGRRVPDLIALQEVYSYEGGCPGSPSNLEDYEVLFRLIRNIEVETGVRYRIAYWGPWKGACGSGWSDKALLYNSDFLVNVPPVGAAEREYGNMTAIQQRMGHRFVRVFHAIIRHH